MEKTKPKRFEQTASLVMGEASVIGRRSLRVLEQKIKLYTGSEVKFSTKNTHKPNLKRLEEAKAKGEKIILIPDTMTVIKQGENVISDPKAEPITIERIFELFHDIEEAKTIYSEYNKAGNEVAKNNNANAYKSPELVKKRKEKYEESLINFNRLAENFKYGLLDLGGLLNMLGQNYDKTISGGWQFIKGDKNTDLKEQEEFCKDNGSRLPSILELFITQLISNADFGHSDEVNWEWLPTTATSTITLETRDVVPARIFLTSSPKKGVGVVLLRNDIPEYKNNILMVSR